MVVLAIAFAGIAFHYVPLLSEAGHGGLSLFFFVTIAATLWLGLFTGLLALAFSLLGINALVLHAVWVENPLGALLLNTGFCLLSGVIIATTHLQHKLIKALREKQQDLKLAQSVGKAGSWRLNVQNKKMQWSTETYRIFGVPEGSAITGETFSSAVRPEDRDYVNECWQAALRGKPFDIEHRIIVGGEVKWIHEKSVLEFSKDGKLQGCFGIVQDITERKQTEIALREQENELRLIINLTPNLIAYLSTDFRYLRINKTYSTWWLKAPEDILGHEVREIVGEPTWNIIRPYMERARSGETVSFDHQSLNTKDACRWVHVDYVPDIDSSGTVKGIVVQVSNITEHILAEQKLRDSEARVRLATEATEVGIWEWNILTDQIRWDAQMFRIFGIPQTPNGFVQYTTWSNAVVPEDLPRQEELLQETIRNFGFGRREYRMQRPDGKGIRNIEAVETVRTNAQGQVEWVVGTNLDITDRRNAEKVLLEQENQLRLIMNLTPALISYLDADFRYVRVNKTYEDWFGVAKENIIGRTVPEIIGEKSWSIVRPYLERARIGAVVRYEHQFEYPNAIRRWVQVTFVPDKDPTGTVKGLVVHVSDIDEMKRHEQEISKLNQTLRHRAEEMQALFDTAPIGLAICDDKEARSIHGNRVIEQMYSLPPNSELSFRNSSPPPIRVSINGHEPTVDELPMQRAARGATIKNQLLDIERPDGQTITILGNAVPLFSEKGEIRGAVGAFLDISALKNAETALRDSEERLRLAQQAGALGIFDHNLISGETQWDARLRELWGVNPDEPITLATFLSGVHPDDRTFVKNALHRAYTPQSKGEYAAEYRIIRPTDNQLFWVAAFGIVTFTDGKPVRIVGFVQDISARKRAEEKLHDTETRLSLALEELKAGYWDWEFKTNFVYYSPIWKQQLGYAENEIPNRFEEWENRLHPDDRALTLEALKHYLNDNLPNYDLDLEFRLQHKNGSYRSIHSRGVLIRDKNHLPNRMVGIHLDITDFKHADDLLRHRKLLEEKAQFQIAGETAAAIAHDLNQPLTAAGFFADAAAAMLQNGNTDPKQIADVLDACSQQVYRAGKVIPQLLALLHKGETDIEPVDINRAIIEVRQLVNGDKLFEPCQIKLNLDVNLPPAKANNLQVQKILLNIVHNGLESMLDGTGNPGILRISTCRLADNPGMLLVTIRDEGPGVSDADQLKKMFNPFYTTKTNGLGMGLTISRNLVEAYGGEIWAEKNAGSGISVNFTLPFM